MSRSSRHRMHPPIRQRGIALITVLFVVALAAALAYGMAERQMTQLQLGARALEWQQAVELALAGETFGRLALLEDVLKPEEGGDPPGTDSLNAGWTQPRTAMQLDEGEVEVTIRDLNGCLNLNSVLVTAPPAATAAAPATDARIGEPAVGQPPARVEPAAAAEQAGADATDGDVAPGKRGPLAMVKRLARELGVREDLADLLRDWIDADQDVEAAGSEDSAYLLEDPPFRTADAPLRDLTEFALLKELEPRAMRDLADHVCTLPTSDLRLNVNTMTAEVIAALSDDIDASRAADWAAADTPWESVDDFVAQDPNGHLNAMRPWLQVHSDYFEIVAEAGYGRASLRLVTRVHRDRESGLTTVLDRDFGRDLPAPWMLEELDY